MRTPHLHDDRSAGLRHSPRLAQRGDHVVREEKRREARDEVEGGVLVGQGLHVADTEVGLGESLARERDQRLRRVDSMRLGAASGDQAEEDADAAADVEHPLAGLERDARERRLVARDVLLLADRPVGGPGAPERSPALGARRGVHR